MERTPKRIARTRIIEKPDGKQVLVVRRLEVKVLQGPDAGQERIFEQTRLRFGTGDECDLRLTDPSVSRCHVELQATEQGLLLKDLDSTNGTLLGGVALQRALLIEPVTLALGTTLLSIAPHEQEVEIPISRRYRFGDLLGQSTVMRELFAKLERVSQSDATVLLEGESGTGKEPAARSIHAASPRRNGPFTIVDCAGIPATLIESELFGHARGSFTGASEDRPGALELADGGTLFLDEVGELPAALQPRLLRFLETRQVKRVGEGRYRAVDARVIAGTNRVIADEVQKGAFRADLYYRLSVVRVTMPPLRDHPEDIPLLAHHFAEQLVRDPRTVITEETTPLLVAYSWPGNVRELRNVVERLALVPELALETLRDDGLGPAASTSATEPEIGPLADLGFHAARTRWLQIFERQYLSAQLAKAEGVVAAAARLADIPRQSFHRMLRRHQLG
jgi:transcriptional regulator with GAF, ATPase, and Fis domain